MNLAEQIKALKPTDLKYFGLDALPKPEHLKLSNVHHKGFNSNATITTDLRYPAPETYPLGAENQHGEIEMLGEVEATHWYAEANSTLWHFATTGNPSNEPLLMVHGFPESWYAFHHQMRDLSDNYYCIAVDTIGNGQSDKRLDLDYTYAGIASYLAALIDKIGLDSFNLTSHDRGSVISDHLLNTNNMNERVLRYVRMQQSANEPHGDPKPPHHILGSPLATIVAKWTQFPKWIYKSSHYKIKDIDPQVLERLDYELKYKGVAECIPLSFKTTSFDKELEDRHTMLFKNMTMPMLFLQGSHDPGQRPEEYENSSDFVINGRVQFIDANHFLHLELPDEVTKALRDFLSTPL